MRDTYFERHSPPIKAFEYQDNNTPSVFTEISSLPFQLKQNYIIIF